MKTNFLYSLLCSIFFVLVALPSIHASHVVGADLNYERIGPDMYKVQLRLFRDCNGIIPSSAYSVQVISASCNVSTVMTLNQIGGPTTITPLCPTEPDLCTQGTGIYGIEAYLYEGIISLPPCPNGGNDWVFSWSECCRNSAITTVNSPGAQSIYIEAQLNNSLSGTIGSGNMSSVFLNDPLAFVCIDQIVSYIPQVTNPDGDSLVFSLANCRDSPALDISYAPPYSGVNPLSTTGGVQIDSSTGQLTFQANLQQVGIICLMVEEFRNGVKVGEIVQDIQVIVYPCSNTPPIASGFNGIANDSIITGNFTVTIAVDSNFCAPIEVFDPNTNDVLQLDWSMNLPGASLTFTPGTPNIGDFCWTPTFTDIGTHLLIVTATDDACPIIGSNSYAYLIEVVPCLDIIVDSVQHVSCFGGNDGAISIATVGGSPPYNYTWENNGVVFNTQNLSGLSAGIYHLTVTTSTGCTHELSVIITEPSPLGVSFSTQPSSGSNGIVTAIPSEGVPPYNYQWDNGGTTSTIVGLAPGFYKLTLTDANTCILNDSVEVAAIVNNFMPETVTQFELSPNPTQGQFEVRLALLREEAVTISIFNTLGQEVFQYEANGQHLTIPINLDHTEAGLYFIQLQVNGQTITRKLLKTL